MKLQNDLGDPHQQRGFTAVTGSAATNCYGVKGMAVRSKTDGLVPPAQAGVHGQRRKGIL